MQPPQKLTRLEDTDIMVVPVGEPDTKSDIQVEAVAWGSELALEILFEVRGLATGGQTRHL